MVALRNAFNTVSMCFKVKRMKFERIHLRLDFQSLSHQAVFLSATTGKRGNNQEV